MSAIVTKINTYETEKNIGELQGKMNSLLDEIKSAINAISNEVEELDAVTFWAIIAEIKKRLSRYSAKDGAFSSSDLKGAVESTIHAVTFDHIRDLESDRETAIRFVKTYENLTGKISKALWDVVEGYGDDGYGDICDSFPLFGQEVVEQALKGKLTVEDPYQGENYVCMSLSEKLVEMYAISCLYDYRGETEEE